MCSSRDAIVWLQIKKLLEDFRSLFECYPPWLRVPVLPVPQKSGKVSVVVWFSYESEGTRVKFLAIGVSLKKYYQEAYQAKDTEVRLTRAC